MKHQYVGDVNDYRKYALLRVLAAGGTNRIGVCWMMTDPDGRTDGKRIGYLDDPKAQAFDPELFALLKAASKEPDWRRLETIEAMPAIPEAAYFNAKVPTGAEPRRAYFARALEIFAGSDLVFFDPDMGLPKQGLTKSAKDAPGYVFLDEAAAIYGLGKSVLVYQHYHRKFRDAFAVESLVRLSEYLPDAELMAFRAEHVVFLLALNPRRSPSLAAAVEAAERFWSAHFDSVTHPHPSCRRR